MGGSRVDHIDVTNLNYKKIATDFIVNQNTDNALLFVLKIGLKIYQCFTTNNSVPYPRKMLNCFVSQSKHRLLLLVVVFFFVSLFCCCFIQSLKIRRNYSRCVCVVETAGRLTYYTYYKHNYFLFFFLSI